MTNKELSKIFKLSASLMELHDENQFKIRAFSGAVYAIDKQEKEIITLSSAELEKLDGFGKSIVSKIAEIKATGSFTELNSLLEATPIGVISMLNIKGIGPKKVKTIWKEAGIETIDALSLACEENKIAQIKGFGEKTQQTILENIVFLAKQVGRFFFAEIEPITHTITQELQKSGLIFSLSGDARRYIETIEIVKYLVANNNPNQLFDLLDTFSFLEKSETESSPYAWRGKALPLGVKVEIKACDETEFGSKLILDSSGEGHLDRTINDNETLRQHFRKHKFASEELAYTSLALPVFLPELREGLVEFVVRSSEFVVGSQNNEQRTNNNELITLKDLKGTLHNHTKYSDGENTLLEMSQRCIEMGLQYFGVADHSKSAQYAGGLYEKDVIKQHQEIDELNKQLAPFKILKGIESDILGDGGLDYEDDILKTFDYVVASVHSGLKMDETKANARLIKAIENPYTTILGHPTGRLLLRRQGYPIDHKKIIDACVANGVVIEINASPYRLDLDWRWIPYAIEKGAMLSINPDAHDLDGLYDMHYGTLAARKGGLTATNCLNAMGLVELEKFLVRNS
jgi:DNA polymerase (family 10)